MCTTGSLCLCWSGRAHIIRVQFCGHGYCRRRRLGLRFCCQPTAGVEAPQMLQQRRGAPIQELLCLQKAMRVEFVWAMQSGRAQGRPGS